MEKSIGLRKNHVKRGEKMIYEKVRKLCKQKKISVYRLEKDLGFSTSTIIKWKKSIPAANKLKAVADYLHVSIEELLEE